MKPILIPMRHYFLSISLFFISIIAFSQQYPVTKKTSTTRIKHNFTFQDDYTWLENMKSDEVINWSNAQNEALNLHLEAVKKEYNIESKIKEYDFLSTNGFPSKRRAYFYGLYRKDKNKPASLCYKKTLNEPAIELVNPFKIYRDENVYITSYYPSKNSTNLAYAVSLNGSDLREIRFVSIAYNKDLDDVLKDIKFSNVAWNNDSGVFYKRTSNQKFFESDSTYQLFYHKIGTAQTDDALIFDTTKTESSFGFSTKEGKLLISEISKDETTANYYYANLNSEPFQLVKYIENDTSEFEFLSYDKGRVYFSSKESDWGEIRSFDINNRADEKLVVSQIYNHLLVDSYFDDDYIICKYKILGSNYIIVYDQDGKFIRKFEAPSGMDFSIKFLDSKTKELYVSFYSYTVSFLNYTLNIETGRSHPYYSDFLPPKTTLFPLDHFETKSITYKSRDNQDVPITIVYKKGIALDGNNPTLLKAYGGFGKVSGPNYDTGLLYFLEKGGVFAYAEIRGGGEKGKKWHLKGKGLNKMNTFNDFIDAAEFLIREKYTSPNKLAITGGSQGGLLVGVAMTQRPDLFKVVIPEVGVFDMVEFGKYTIGKFHYDEYGNPQNESEFKSLMAYSPYHNIKEDVNYPTCLIITSENDDRVPPFHSFKFAARLQNRAAQKNPVYLQTQSNSGHYGKVSNYKNRTASNAEFFDFLLFHLNQ